MPIPRFFEVYCVWRQAVGERNRSLGISAARGGAKKNPERQLLFGVVMSYLSIGFNSDDQICYLKVLHCD